MQEKGKGFEIFDKKEKGCPYYVFLISKQAAKWETNVKRSNKPFYLFLLKASGVPLERTTFSLVQAHLGYLLEQRIQ